MQYLIRTLTDSTGTPFTHVTKARENETFTVVEAESKEEALERVKKPKGLLNYVPSEFNNNPISMALKASIYRKSSE
ncbi:DUF1381 domain-containing protein [Staphylococcus gallinarum]|uniref:Phage protein n=1 Tax=Staphylococcus gallinarum TaxID=1293 RepID=A0A0D0SJF3_STAGA|nr:DUF1381 domain-containing protein [Staphylococcus gallinarum]KIR10428.1 hypothetical protein SH09_13305 [Staphylococcus gallinarum]RTX73495.1 DUF1381 domain-containing protein [Staphylococcus gallinarum]GEQ06995.1 hypothetical protein SGA02_28230 [Staphylococcus gallinarum]SUM34048.1 phage protein [Staphylococcus gallinarum]